MVKTNVHFLLDMTGSMEMRRKEAIDSTNEYVKGLAANKATQDFNLALSVFNSQIGTKTIVESKNVTKIPELTPEDYTPDWSTPLLDAVGHVLKIMDKKRGPKLVIINTDGQENCSKEFNKDTIESMIKERIDKGWQIVWLTEGLDAVSNFPTMTTLNTSYSTSGEVGSRSAAIQSLVTDTISYAKRGSVASDDFAKKKVDNNHGNTK